MSPHEAAAVFFPEGREMYDLTEAAARICGGCPVRSQCRGEARANPLHSHGIWGGESERDRGVVVGGGTVGARVVQRRLGGTLSAADRDRYHRIRAQLGK